MSCRMRGEAEERTGEERRGRHETEESEPNDEVAVAFGEDVLLVEDVRLLLRLDDVLLLELLERERVPRVAVARYLTLQYGDSIGV